MITNEIVNYCLGNRLDLASFKETYRDQYRLEIFADVIRITSDNGECFAFGFGVAVFWGSEEGTQLTLIEQLSQHLARLPEPIIDRFSYSIEPGNSTIRNDHIVLPNAAPLTRLAVSHGLAQSAKLEQFEAQVQTSISDTVRIPENLARSGHSDLSREQIGILRGKLFLVKSDIILNYDLLDTPEFFWDYPELDPYYQNIIGYLELKPRIEILSKKLETIHELLEMLADEQKHKHSSLLEWIIIWLIAFEIAIFLFHDVLKWL